MRSVPLWAIGALIVLALLVFANRYSTGSSEEYMGTVIPGNRKLTVYEVYYLARQAGFPPDVARTMVAIAIRESGLDPSARCLSCFPGIQEDSIGLWQINMLGSLGAARMLQFGLTSKEELLDPEVNARAAYLTWGGSDRNLNIAWRINEEGAYQYRTKYLQALNSLPALDTLELAYNRFGSGEGVPA